jgi:hypothetical protein
MKDSSERRRYRSTQEPFRGIFISRICRNWDTTIALQAIQAHIKNIDDDHANQPLLNRTSSHHLISAYEDHSAQQYSVGFTQESALDSYPKVPQRDFEN